MASKEPVDPRRIRQLTPHTYAGGPVVYWMSRDQRVGDNWALLHASSLARANGVPLAVVFTLAPTFLGAALRQYDFMLRGLAGVEEALLRHGIPFTLLAGNPVDELQHYLARHAIGALVTDFSPLRTHRSWKEAIARTAAIPFDEVDAHNIVPCWVASEKREFSAATFRPKIHRLLSDFLVDFPPLPRQRLTWPEEMSATDWSAVRRKIRVDHAIGPVAGFIPGEKAARKALRRFIAERLPRYGTGRNDPSDPCQSNLSPSLHFGHIAPQRVAYEVAHTRGLALQRASYLEELIVRRELSDNFCLYAPDYDTPASFPAWAAMTHARHAGDARPYRYSHALLERGETHDPLWNAAQMQMVSTGHMHGYMRMYWAKKILEWTPGVDEAMRIAVDLNDRYELDGRDPNGYAGIAWSMGGVHDRAWGERPVFGKIRYMNYEGCKRKFDVRAYIRLVQKGVR